MRMLDLFSGAGGFSLAGRWAGWETIEFVEKDKDCQKVLQKNFPGVPIHDDIKTYKGEKRSADIICGGFPCQPFSTSGKRAGTTDDRYLWPEMLRIIDEVRPSWVCGENVTGLLSMGVQVSPTKVESKKITRWPESDHYEAILSRQEEMLLHSIRQDLEKIGYWSEFFVIPALAIGAPHRRDRIWIIAHSQGCNDRQHQGGENQRQKQKSGVSFEPENPGHSYGSANGHDITREGQGAGMEMGKGPMGGPERDQEKHHHRNTVKSLFTDTHHQTRGAEQKQQSKEWFQINPRGPQYTPNSSGIRLEKPDEPGTSFTESQRKQQGSEFTGTHPADTASGWTEHWAEAYSRISGVDDGFSRGVDRCVSRNARIKMMGNSIVPQVAFEIFKAVNEANKHFAI